MRVCIDLSASVSVSVSVSHVLRVYTSKYLFGNRSLLDLYNCKKEI